MVCWRLWSTINLLINVCSLWSMACLGVHTFFAIHFFFHRQNSDNSYSFVSFSIRSCNNDRNGIVNHIYLSTYFIGKFRRINRIFQLNSEKSDSETKKKMLELKRNIEIETKTKADEERTSNLQEFKVCKCSQAHTQFSIRSEIFAV